MREDAHRAAKGSVCVMADVASLNDTLQRKKDEKYDYALETEIRLWVGELVKREEEFTDAGNSLQELLKNGEVLCEYVHAFTVLYLLLGSTQRACDDDNDAECSDVSGGGGGSGGSKH